MFDRVSAIARGERKQGKEKELWYGEYAVDFYPNKALKPRLNSKLVVIGK